MSITEPPALVSIIIPCFDGEKLVAEAIQSALDQTYPNKEVIVIDDGSTDGSLDVIKSFGDQIRWETGPNKGACAARNRGLKLARGAWIQFLDADDLLHADKLEKQMPVCLREAPRIVYCGREVVPVEPSEDPREFALVKIIDTCTPVYQASTLRAVGGYREGLSCAQDYELHLRLALDGASFARMEDVLVNKRRQASSVSSDSTKVLEQFRALWWEAHATMEKRGLLTDTRRRALAGRMAGAGRAYLRHGRPGEARACFADARRMDPGGGIPQAYSPATRLMRALVGAQVTERLVVLQRRAMGRSF